MKPERTKRSPRDDTARAAADRQAREIERLQRENDRLREQLDEQAKRIADLERQLALRQQNSTTTSKPPSSDGLAGRQRLRGRRVKSRRKAGGQPGHPGHHRELVPLERVDAVVDLVPETCRRCAHRLHARDDEGDPRRHQVTEVPPIAAHITEYRCHRRHCPACGTRTVAAVPDECAGQFGPQLAALIAYLTVICRLPRLVVQRLLADVLQIPLSLGSTQHAWEEASAAVAAPYKELRQALANQPVLNADETGHRTNGATRWLWTLVAPTFVFYPGFPFCQPDQGLHTPTRLSARQISSAHVIPLPTPVRWGRARRETDWSPCFQGISQAPLHTCALSSPLRCTQAARQPPGTGSAQILRSMSPNSRRVRCPSASRSQ